MNNTPLPDNPSAADRERLLLEACDQYEKALVDAEQEMWFSAAAHRDEARVCVAAARAV